MRVFRSAQSDVPRSARQVRILENEVERAPLRVFPERLVEADCGFEDVAVLSVAGTGEAVTGELTGAIDDYRTADIIVAEITEKQGVLQLGLEAAETGIGLNGDDPAVAVDYKVRSLAKHVAAFAIRGEGVGNEVEALHQFEVHIERPAVAGRGERLARVVVRDRVEDLKRAVNAREFDVLVGVAGL